MMAFAPMFIVDLLSGLGLGEQVFVAVILLFAAFEVTRIAKAGRRAGSFVGGMMWYSVIIFVAVAAAVLLGWVDPNPGKVIADLTSWAGAILDTVGRWVLEKLRGMF